MFARLQAAFDVQLPPDPPRYREPTEAEIVARTTKVRADWQDDEARFIETLCDALCEASPSVQASIAALAHQGRSTDFGKAVLALFDPKWFAEARRRAEDELAGIV